MRRFLVVAVLLVSVASLLVYYIPPLRFTVTGRLNGEPRANGMPASFWVHTVRYSDDTDRRIDAANTLVEMGPSTEGAVEAFRSVLADPDPRVRTAAATALGQMATVDQAGEDLIKLLADEDGPVRAAAASSIGQLRPAGRPVLDTLLAQAKKDGFVQAKCAAIMALGLYEESAFDAVPALIESLLESDTPNGSPHEAAVFALAKICHNRTPALTPALARTDGRMRVGILKTLASIGPPAANTLPDVLTMTTVSDPMVRLEAAQTQWRIEQKAAGPLSIARQQLQVAQPDRMKRIGTRTKAMYLMGEMGGASMAAVPELIATMNDAEDSSVRMYAAMALGKIGRTPEILNALGTTAKTDKDPDVCWAANETLKQYKVK